MFVADEVLLDLSFAAAVAQLTEMARGGLLTRVSQGAYGDGLTGLARVGPLGAAPGMSKLVELHLLDVVTRGESAVLPLRWQATGPGGRLFPALDADLALTPRRGARHSAIAGRGLPAAARHSGRGPGQGYLPQRGPGDDAVPADPRRGRSHPPPEPARRRAGNLT